MSTTERLNPMQLAERTQKIAPSLTLSVDSKAKYLKSEGVDVIGFGAGEPDFDTPDHIKLAAAQALAEGFTKYTPAAGMPELRQAIAEKLKNENQIDYKPSQVVVTCGAKHACYNSIMAVCDPGDEVVIPAPYWLSYPEMARLAGAEPYIIETTEGNNWKMTPEEFQNAISPRTRMVILNTPSNPTGSVYNEKELSELVEVALEDDIYILSDEIYEKMVYDGEKHVSVASFSRKAYDLTLTINGFSKAYAMTGWRLGYVAAAEPIAKVIDTIQGHSTPNPTSFAQKGALAALKEPSTCVEDMVKEFAVRRDLIMKKLNEIPGISCVEPKGAFYVFPNISSFGLNSTDFCTKLLDEKQVAAVPGIAFGDDRCIRLSYACSRETIENGLQRISQFCAKLKS